MGKPNPPLRNAQKVITVTSSGKFSARRIITLPTEEGNITLGEYSKKNGLKKGVNETVCHLKYAKAVIIRNQEEGEENGCRLKKVKRNCQEYKGKAVYNLTHCGGDLATSRECVMFEPAKERV